MDPQHPTASADSSSVVPRGHEAHANSFVQALRRQKIGAALFGDAPQPLRLGRFEVHGLLGEGGMGTVLDAHDPELDRRVALKLLQREGAGHEDRLRHEAKALAKLSHPNVVQVYEVGAVDDRLFIAMERIEGQTLAAWQAQPRPWTECLDVYAQAGAGLAAAHARGLIHRDFKPANCILDEEGRVRVLDFGLVRVEADAEVELAGTLADSERASSSSLTRTGIVLGTVAYMAPEQLLGRSADARSDQFSFCVALYEALHGHRPYRGRNPNELLHSMLSRRIDRPARRAVGPAVPRAIDRILLRGLAVEQRDRWPSMAALLAKLARVPGARRRRIAIAAGTAVLTIATIAAVTWPRPGACDGMRELEARAWTEVRRDAVAQALRSADPARGEAAWRVVARELDRYAASLIDARASACEAAHVERSLGPQSYELRLACLDRRMDRMAALVDQLALADRSVVARASAAVDALPSIATCLDAEGLLARDEIPSELRPRADEVRAQLDDTWAKHQAGRSEAAAVSAEQIVARVEPLAERLPQLHAEARLLRATIDFAARRIPTARAHLHVALTDAERAHDEALAMEVLRTLINLETWAGSVSTAQAWLTMARARAQAIGPDAIELAIAEGLLALEDGRAATARERFDHAVELARDHDPEAELALARALRLRGEAELDLGQPADARASLSEALQRATELASAIEQAAVLHDLGLVERDLDRPDVARERFEQALAVQIEIFGAAAPVSIHTHIGLFELALQRGDTAEAEREAAAARAIFEHDPTVEPLSQGLFFMMVAALRRDDDPAAAMADYQRAREAFAAMPEPDQGAIAMADTGHADCLAALGRPEQARARYEQALARLDAHVDPEHPRWVFALRGYASLLLEQGEHTAALPHLRRLLELNAAGARDPELDAWLHAQLTAERAR